MTQYLEMDDPVAFTHCPCCKAAIEVRVRDEWGDDGEWYVVVPSGTPDASITREAYQAIVKAQEEQQSSGTC